MHLAIVYDDIGVNDETCASLRPLPTLDIHFNSISSRKTKQTHTHTHTHTHEREKRERREREEREG